MGGGENKEEARVVDGAVDTLSKSCAKSSTSACSTTSVATITGTTRNPSAPTS
jgi:hypothetical protein